MLLLSEMTANAVPIPASVLGGLALLTLALWAGGIVVILRRGWAAKVGGGGLLLGAVVSTLVTALLLAIAPPPQSVGQQGMVIEVVPTPQPKTLDQP